MAQTAPVLDKDKVAPDEGALIAGAFESLAGQKVQLDIDDAPFMMPDEPPPSLPATNEGSVAKTEEAEPPKKRFSKKVVIIISAAAVLLLALAGGGAFYFLNQPPPVPEVPPTIIVVPPSELPAAVPTALEITLDPFWVDITDTAGKGRFLVATFTLATEKPELHKEIADKMVTLRDAVFYYLRGKDYAFLTAPNNSSQIKDDLLAAINNYLVQGELTNLYFDSFLVR